MRRAFLTAAILMIAGGSSSAQDRCADLWYERNEIYKNAGYCFRTAQAIRAFGNAGCMYDNQQDVPLSARARGRVAEIVRLERAYACPR